MAATNQLANNVALVAGTKLVNLKASAATFVIPKKMWPSRELHNKSAIYFFRYLCLYSISIFIDVCLDALFGIWSNQKHEWNKEK
jgi:hypothetical protein